MRTYEVKVKKISKDHKYKPMPSTDVNTCFSYHII